MWWIGSTGEYSDRSEWPVVAYTGEQDAKEHVLAADAYARAEAVYRRSDEWYAMDWDEQKHRNESNPFDPRFSMIYDSTTYTYEEVELKDKFMAPETVQ